jgi:hypothetical protein
VICSELCILGYPLAVSEHASAFITLDARYLPLIPLFDYFLKNPYWSVVAGKAGSI